MDPRFGVRDIDDVAAVGAANGFSLEQRFPMPANNITVVFVRDRARP
jgi:hypothetical protein